MIGDVTNVPLEVESVFAGMLFVLGACIGSFLNVVIYRLPAGLSIVAPPSRCPACQTLLRAVDNIPIVSWLVLRGRCRTCAARISARYPLVELSTGMIFARLGWLAFDDRTPGEFWDFSAAFWLSLALRLAAAGCLIVVVCWDWDRVRMPVGFMWFVLAIGAANLFISARDFVIQLAVVVLALLLAVTVCFVEKRFHRQTNWRSALAVAVLGGTLANLTPVGLALIMATVAQLVLAIPSCRRTAAEFRLGWPALAAGGILAMLVMRPESFPSSLTNPWLDAIAATVIVAMLAMLTQVMARRQSSSLSRSGMSASHSKETPWTEN